MIFIIILDCHLLKETIMSTEKPNQDITAILTQVASAGKQKYPDH